jgi:tRNA nucleotidyltransferase (CCA-adding enzyme)
LRRPQRFEEVLAACEADYRGRLGHAERPYPQAGLWRAALAAARAVDAGAIARTCVDPVQIAERIHAARVAAVKQLGLPQAQQAAVAQP